MLSISFHLILDFRLPQAKNMNEEDIYGMKVVIYKKIIEGVKS
jgi:hypothetical protein